MKNSNLNPRYTFENFIVGNYNRFAYKASIEVANNPAKSYNPLFIYGEDGVGKTHLIQAIGNKIIQNNSKFNIFYITSNKFINEMIHSIKEPIKKSELFIEQFKNIDVFLIDDIQFVVGKERVQEELFCLFDKLYKNGKQIILTSDRPPKDMPQLEERLKNRFEWGIVADVLMPDYETRLAILDNKVKEKNINIDIEILQQIAKRDNLNIRELEGIVNQLVAFSSLENALITKEMIDDYLKLRY